MNLKMWNMYVIDLEKFIKFDCGFIYCVSIKFLKEDVIYNCGFDGEGDSEEGDGEMELEEGYMLDFINEDFNWLERIWYGFNDGFDIWYDYGDDYDVCDNSYYYGKVVSWNIFVFDFGMICKIDENKVFYVYVNDLFSVVLQKDVIVQYYDFVKQFIIEGKIDVNGMYLVFFMCKFFLLIVKWGE